jgi:hypothetical protein
LDWATYVAVGIIALVWPGLIIGRLFLLLALGVGVRGLVLDTSRLPRGKALPPLWAFTGRASLRLCDEAVIMLSSVSASMAAPSSSRVFSGFTGAEDFNLPDWGSVQVLSGLLDLHGS